MAVFKSRGVWVGIAIGAGAVVIAPFVLPIVAAVLRPLAKETIKQSLLLLDLAREQLATAIEGLQDLVAEARSEAAQARDQRRAAAPTVAEGDGRFVPHPEPHS